MSLQQERFDRLLKAMTKGQPHKRPSKADKTAAQSGAKAKPPGE